MVGAGKILGLCSAILAAIGLLLVVYIMIITAVYHRQLRKCENDEESEEKHELRGKRFAFDWQYDDFERRFSLIFNIPSIVLIAACCASIVTAIAAAIVG